MRVSVFEVFDDKGSTRKLEELLFEIFDFKPPNRLAKKRILFKKIACDVLLEVMVIDPNCLYESADISISSIDQPSIESFTHSDNTTSPRNKRIKDTINELETLIKSIEFDMNTGTFNFIFQPIFKDSRNLLTKS